MIGTSLTLSIVLMQQSQPIYDWTRGLEEQQQFELFLDELIASMEEQQQQQQQQQGQQERVSAAPPFESHTEGAQGQEMQQQGEPTGVTPTALPAAEGPRFNSPAGTRSDVGGTPPPSRPGSGRPLPFLDLKDVPLEEVYEVWFEDLQNSGAGGVWHREQGDTTRAPDDAGMPLHGSQQVNALGLGVASTAMHSYDQYVHAQRHAGDTQKTGGASSSTLGAGGRGRSGGRQQDVAVGGGGSAWSDVGGSAFAAAQVGLPRGTCLTRRRGSCHCACSRSLLMRPEQTGTRSMTSSSNRRMADLVDEDEFNSREPGPKSDESPSSAKSGGGSSRSVGGGKGQGRPGSHRGGRQQQDVAVGGGGGTWSDVGSSAFATAQVCRPSVPP
jgi:hypothetical protein